VDGGTPLEVIRVFVGGASEGLLQVGDRIVSINHQSMENISHFEAQHLFKSSGPSVRLEVGRLVQSACPVPPAPSVSPMRRRHQLSSLSSTPSYLHLPAPRDPTFSKPQESETFKIILREEMASAQNQSGISARKFDKTLNNNRPSSQQSDLSDDSRRCRDPLMKNTAINQSSSFKKLMNAVLGDSEF